MKKPSLPDRLAVALLSEIASGHYTKESGFLSRREIMRQWKVSSPTATKSLHILVDWDILYSSDRSGHYFCPQFLQRALLRLNKSRLAPLPGQPSWDARARHLRQPETKLQRIAVISVTDGLDAAAKFGPGRRRAYSEIPDIHLSVPIRIAGKAIFSVANEEDVAVDFYLDDGSASTGDEIVRTLIASRIQGVIILRRLLAASVSPLAAPLITAGIPVVAVFDDCEHLKMVSVNFNNVGIGYKAAQAFLAAGHRHIAAAFPLEMEAPNYYRDRFHGCELAAAEHNEAHPDDRVAISPLALPLSIGEILPEATSLFSKDNPSRATALLSTSVNLLLALEASLKKERLAIPEDLSVIMCSSTPFLPPKGRELDIMKLDFEEIGGQAFIALKSLFESRFTEKTWLVDSQYHPYGSIAHRVQGRAADTIAT